MRPLIPGEVLDPSPPRPGPRLGLARPTTPRRPLPTRRDAAPWLALLALVTVLAMALLLDAR